MSRSCRSALLLVALGVFFVPLLLLHAQVDDGRLYNPPKLDIAGWLASSPYESADESPAFGAPIAVTQGMELKFESMLPMIFFDTPGSTTPAARYRLLSNLSEAAHYSDTLPVIVPAINNLFNHYMSNGTIPEPSRRYEVLDVIGARLRRFPDAELEIEGGYTGGIEDTSVAMRRAELVRDHFLLVWGIAPGRLHILPPAMLSRPGASLAREQEARRVTMYSRNARIFDPMVFHVVQTSSAFLHLSALLDPRFAPEDIRSVELSVAVGDALVYRDWLQPTASSRYQIEGVVPIYWMIDNPVDLVIAQAVVTLNDGRQFTSNQARLPFDVHGPERYYWIDSTMRVYNDDGIFLMPFQEMGEMRFGQHQERLLREACDSIHSIMDNPWGNQLWLDKRTEDSSSHFDEVRAMKENDGDGENVIEGETVIPAAIAAGSLPDVDSALFQVLDPPKEPRIRIYSYTDAMEVIADALLAEYEYAMRSSELRERYYRAFQQEITAAIMSPAVPPRMVIVANKDASASDDEAGNRESDAEDETENESGNQVSELMTQWIGFDAEDRGAQIEEVIEEAIGKLPHDSTWEEGSYQADSGLNARAQTLTRTRVMAVRDRLVQILGPDSNRVQIQCDTDEVNLNQLHDLRELMLPENRMLERRMQVDVTVASAPYPQIEPRYDDRDIIESVEMTDSVGVPDSTWLAGDVDFSASDSASSGPLMDTMLAVPDSAVIALPDTMTTRDTVIKSSAAMPGHPLSRHQRIPPPPPAAYRDGIEARRP